MGLTLLVPPNPTTEQLRRELDRLFAAVPTPNLLGHFDIATIETKVRHGLNAIPSGWREYSPRGFGRVRETKAADRTNLYLIADTDVTVGIEVF